MTAFTALSGRSVEMCIYTITHRDSGRVYVGQTRLRAGARWSMHVSVANRNRAESKSFLHAAIRKHGRDAFDFAVIDLAENLDQLQSKERFWIKTLKSLAPFGFNLESGGGAGKVVSEFTREKLRQALLKNPIHKTGVKKSAAHCRAIGAAKRGSVPWNKGIPMTTERKEALSVQRKGKASHSHVAPVVRSDGVVFAKMKDAAEAIGVHRSSILDVITGRRNSVKGYTFKYHVEAA